jgi:hypothetical protein
MSKAKTGSPDRHLDLAISKTEEQKLRPAMDLASALREITFLFLRFTPTLSATSHQTSSFRLQLGHIIWTKSLHR